MRVGGQLVPVATAETAWDAMTVAWKEAITEDEARAVSATFPDVLDGNCDEAKGAALDRIVDLAARLRSAFSTQEAKDGDHGEVQIAVDDVGPCPDCQPDPVEQEVYDAEHGIGSSPAEQKAEDLDTRWKAKFIAAADQRDELACQLREQAAEHERVLEALRVWRERLWDEVHAIDGSRKGQLVQLGRDLDSILSPSPSTSEEAG
jgi:hypothetical protein